MQSQREFKLDFRFVIPNETTLAVAQSLCKSADSDERLVAETAIEVGELSRKTGSELENVVEHRVAAPQAMASTRPGAVSLWMGRFEHQGRR